MDGSFSFFFFLLSSKNVIVIIANHKKSEREREREEDGMLYRELFAMVDQPDLLQLELLQLGHELLGDGHRVLGLEVDIQRPSLAHKTHFKPHEFPGF